MRTGPGGGSRILQDPPAEVLTEDVTAFGLLMTPARLHIVWALARGKSDATGAPRAWAGRFPRSAASEEAEPAGLVRSLTEDRPVVARATHSTDWSDPDALR